jgi:hypothetical protein
LQSNEFRIVSMLQRREITFAKAEGILRGTYGSGLSATNYQQIYNYLDEVVGVLDGRPSTSDQYDHFGEFLETIGFPESFT